MKSRHVVAGIALALLFAASQVLAAGGTVSGKIVYKGKVPGRKALEMAADPLCAAKHTDPARSEAMVVNENGTLKNVFVYVKKGLEGKTFDTPAQPVILDQNGCLYVPHVIGVQTGQPIEILNSDGTLHNVHPRSKINREFNLAMPKFLKKKTAKFEKAEVMIPVKCDVHPWMQSYIGVLDHPFFSVTGDGGAFELKGLPAGTYTIEAWHEICGTQTQEVTVKEGAAQALDFTFALPEKN